MCSRDICIYIHISRSIGALDHPNLDLTPAFDLAFLAGCAGGGGPVAHLWAGLGLCVGRLHRGGS